MNLLDKFHHWRRKWRWNRQYRKGRWDNLKRPIENPRYHQIESFIQEFGPERPSVLDLGCGEGILTERMDENSYSYFKGIDYSSVSIVKANDKKLPKSEFEAWDIIDFTPKKSYDVIVFNEAFYYIPDSEKQKVLDRMCAYLKESGIIIVSIFRKGVGSWPYFKNSTVLSELAFTTVTSEEENRYWKVGVYELS